MARLEAEDWDYDALPGGRAPIVLARQRLGRGWRMLVATGLGILVTVSLLCAVPLYNALVQNVQIQHTLAEASVNQINVAAQFTIQPRTIGDVTTIRDQALTASRRDMAGVAPASDWSIELDRTLTPTNARTPAPASSSVALPGGTGKDSNPRQVNAFVFDYASALPHMNLLAGRLPADTALSEPAEVLVTPKLGLVPGDTFTLAEVNKTVRVAGVWFPKDLNDPYWNGYNYDTVAIYQAPLTFPALFTQNGFFSTFYLNDPSDPAFLRGGDPLTLSVVAYTDPHRITAANMNAVSQRITGYSNDVQSAILVGSNGVRTVAFDSGPASLIAATQTQFAVLNLPLYVIVAQAAGLALLFAVAMAALMVEEHAGAIATLRSRGASLAQLQLSFALHALALVGVAALLGPPLATALSLLVVRFLIPGASGLQANPLSGGYLSGTVSPRQVVGPALLGAGLGFVAILFATWQATRSDALAYRLSLGRSREVPLWKRYYVDLALAAVCCAGWVELSFFGGLSVRTQLAGARPHTDPVLLATPGLLLLAGALVTLRLFPLAARFLAWVAAKSRGAAGLIGCAQVARAGSHLLRLTLLLTLAVALGVFTLAFHESLGVNAATQAAYIAGGDERIAMPQANTVNAFTLQQAYQSLPGVTLAMPAFRGEARLNGNDNSTGAGMLAVDDQSFARAAYWPVSDAEHTPESLMAAMRAHQAGPDAGTIGHPIWAIVDDAFLRSTSLRAGDDFALTPVESSYALQFVVGAVVHRIPTLTDPTTIGNVLVDAHAYIGALVNPSIGAVYTVTGPNEMWLRTSADPTSARARATLLSNNALPAGSIVDRRALEDQIQRDPLSAGIAGLLEVSAWLAAALAIIGVVTQSALAARMRLTQFTVMRTLGASVREMARALLSEQLVVYVFGLLVGGCLGAALSTTTLPILRYAGQLGPAAGLNLPPYAVAFPATALVLLFAALLVGCALGLGLATRSMRRAGLGEALRLGED